MDDGHRTRAYRGSQLSWPNYRQRQRHDPRHLFYLRSRLLLVNLRTRRAHLSSRMAEHIYLLIAPDSTIAFLDPIDLYQHVKRTWPEVAQVMRPYYEMDEALRATAKATLLEGINVQQVSLRAHSYPFLAKN